MQIQALWSVVMLIVFIGIVIWAFSSNRDKDFEEAADIPLKEDFGAKAINAKEQKD